MATKLPSGKYRSQVFTGYDDSHKRLYKAFLADTNDEADFLALQFKVVQNKQETTVSDMTVGQAIDKYINAKSNVLSPSTVREYRRCRKNDFETIINIPLKKISQESIQICINEYAANHAPKTVRNIHGVLSAALKTYKPSMNLSTTLPKKKKTKIVIPSEKDMTAVFLAIKGTELEVPIYLAACCGMRRSEIVGLKWNCVDLKKNTLTVNAAKVRGENNVIMDKGTKTVAGTRIIRLIASVAEVLKNNPNGSDYVTLLSGDTIYNRFSRLLEVLQIKHYRFHDLRHYTVSVMLSLNIPKNYIADYMGHETEDMIDNVYGHIMKEKKTKVEEQLDTYFLGLLQHDLQHD